MIENLDILQTKSEDFHKPMKDPFLLEAEFCLMGCY